jgi:phenylpropionate dioxygenase-like ring-hydroxylating dioxygenase large terminal subunit
MNYKPALFTKDVLSLKPNSIKLHGRNLVVWRNNKGRLVCQDDVCSHRGAKLSDGRIEKNCLECPYHGWKFDSKGVCRNIPQLTDKKTKIPKACNIKSYDIFNKDGILWIGVDDDVNESVSNIEYIKGLYSLTNNNEYFITDYFLDAPYSYALQIENLLDPAHLHFVHDGFQGNRSIAGAIHTKNLIVNNNEISALFVDENDNIPQIHIKFYIPLSMIEVSIINKDNDIIRKNIIFVSVKENGKCNVMFRDVAYKKYFSPENKILKNHIDLFIDVLAKDFVSKHYQLVNNEVVASIMQQDIDVLEGQSNNIKNYLDFKYCLLTESDRLIVEFRKWLRNQPNANMFI